MLNMEQKHLIALQVGDYVGVEACLTSYGRTVDEMCVATPMARSTWQRWKSGKTGGPTLRQWNRLKDVLAEFTVKPQEDAA